MRNESTFRKNLKRIMKARDMKPGTLAALMEAHGIGLNVLTVRRWLYDQYEPRLTVFFALCGALGVSADEFRK